MDAEALKKDFIKHGLPPDMAAAVEALERAILDCTVGDPALRQSGVRKTSRGDGIRETARCPRRYDSRDNPTALASWPWFVPLAVPRAASPAARRFPLSRHTVAAPGIWGQRFRILNPLCPQIHRTPLVRFHQRIVLSGIQGGPPVRFRLELGLSYNYRRYRCAFRCSCRKARRRSGAGAK